MHSIADSEKKYYAGIYLLEYMVNKPCTFPVYLSGGNEDLEPVLEWLLVERNVEIQQNSVYQPTDKGRKELKKFMVRYTEFLRFYDIYCAVDLASGEFAFAYYCDFEDQELWHQFLSEERWDDLRVAVCSYKKINPVETVLMSFINEERFGRDHCGWQFDLLLGSVWDEIIEICDTSIQWKQLDYESESGHISGEKVIKDIIRQGEILLTVLHKKEALDIVAI